MRPFPATIRCGIRVLYTVLCIRDKEILSKTSKLEDVDQLDYDAVFYPGGHGPLWDLAESKDSISLIESFIRSNKPVAAVCHAPGVFKNTKKADGSSLVNGKKVTGFTNTEEAAVQLTDVVPYLLEDQLQELGGVYQKVDDWHPLAVVDGLLITGQNPGSSELVAQALLKAVG